MFKLESYITPWLLSYIDQYVKLRREDFQLSLWGGDVVFTNLELRLANIQKLVPALPIIFQSGIIHELRIHIPWIRINSEPIVVTINQIELVIVLNKEQTSADDAPVSFPPDQHADNILMQQQQPSTPEQSNYVQTVLARILNNVHIIVNNLVVKFIEEDIVISLSSRTAQCFAVNQHWTKSFIELTQQDLSLRRLITLPDITLCLDKRDSTGKVHRYEVPLLSRCSIECRIQMLYANVYQQLNTKPVQTRLTLNCANIEVSIVDNQLSMIRRLTEIIILVVDRQIHFDEAAQAKEATMVAASMTPLMPSLPSTPLPLPTSFSFPTDQTNPTDESQAGWISWAWSYVPSVNTLFVEDELPTDGTDPVQQPLNTEPSSTEEPSALVANQNSNSNTPTPLLLAGIDLDRISLQYKVTKSSGEKYSLVPFISFIVEKANIIVERYKPTSTTALDGQSVVSRVRKVKVSTSRISLTWDERLCLSLSDVHFTLHYDRHVRMTRLSLLVNNFNAHLNNQLLLYPFQATLKLDHLRTYSLLHLELSSLTGKLDFNVLAHLITVIDQIRTIVEMTLSLFQHSKAIEHVDDDNISVDDLRNGSMKCVFQSTTDLPNVNEVVFTQTDHRNLASCMTWKYPERRSILKCHILPLPFDDDLTGIVLTQRIKTVECLMQYWHFGTKQFVTWQTLELSDGEPLFLDFTNELGQNPFSEMWRIVLVNASSVINQADSLAASTRIDSLQSQRYEPSIEMSIVVPNIRVHFMIDPQKDNQAFPFESILRGCKHDVFTLNLDNISFDFSQRLETKLMGIETTLSLDVLEYRFLTKRACIEPALINLDLFMDGSKSSILTSSSEIFNLNNGKYHQLFSAAKSSFLYQLHFAIDHINIRLSQSLFHLINILHQDWIRSDMMKIVHPHLLATPTSDRPFYYTYYLFTNHVNCSIGLKQSNSTDSFLVLPPGRTTDFAWSRLNSEQQLIQFSLEHLSTDPFYSSPIDIHQADGKPKQLVQFDHSPHSFYMQIQYDNHQIRRHIHLIGRFIVKNLSDLDLNVQLSLAMGSKQINLSLGSHQSYSSCLQTIDDIQYVQWNASNKYPIDQLNADGTIASSEHTSLWIHLFHDEQFTCLIFAPIVIYRSFLTQPVRLHINTTKSCLLPSNGSYALFYDLKFDTNRDKYEHRLQQIDADQLTDSIFVLSRHSHLLIKTNEPADHEGKSSIDFLLQTTMPSSSERPAASLIDLLRQEQAKNKQTDDDAPVPLIDQSNEILNTSLIPMIGANGPAMYEQPIQFPTRKPSNVTYPTTMTSNSIDCRIEPVRLYSQLNTILIQLKPLTLVNNRTPFNFHLYANAGHDHIYLASNEVTCLSKLEYSQMQFLLIDPHDGEHIQCQTVELFLRNVPMMSSSSLIHNRLHTNGYLDLYFIKSSNNDYFVFHLRHDYLDHTHVFTLESKYHLFNQTTHALLCYVLPISKQQYAIDYPFHSLEMPSNGHLHLYRFQGIPSTDISYYLLFQHAMPEKQPVRFISKPIRLMPVVDDTGDRQCCCLFHRDHLLKHEPNKSKSMPFDPSYQSLRGDLFSINQVMTPLTYQIEISIQSNPSWAFLEIVNTCPCSLLCRLETISSMSHMIPPFSSVYIGIDSSDSSSTNGSSPTATHNHLQSHLTNGSRFYLAPFLSDENSNQHSMDLVQLVTHYFQQLTAKTTQWSRPVTIDSKLEDVFLPIPGLHDVLIRSLPVSLAASRTLIIEPVHRQRPTKTMTTSKSSSSVTVDVNRQKANLSSGNSTIISETIPRQYRSSLTDKAPPTNIPNATSQYLRAWQQQYNQSHHRQIQLNFQINKISFSLMDELTDVCHFREILRLTIDKMNLLLYQRFIDVHPRLHQQEFFCSVHQLQIDNQCYSSKSNFDFPVVLMSKDERRVSKAKVNVYEKREPTESTAAAVRIHRRENSSSSIDTTVTEDASPSFDSLSHNHRMPRSTATVNDEPKCLAAHFHRVNERFIRMDFQIQPFEVYLEDHYIYLLLKIFSDLLPLPLTVPVHRTGVELVEALIDSPLMRIPFVCESLYIGPVDIVVSVHASMKVYIGCHQLPMFVDRFQKNAIYSTNKQLLSLITRHYLMSLLTRSPLLLGSFDLLGNPSVLIRNVTDGIYDLFHLPYVGMRHGPSGFMSGISEGATSLLKHLSLGTLTSLTTFANSVARNMDRLAMDSEHTNRTEETCRQIPMGMTNGLLQGLQLFSLSLLGAVAGLAEQPMASFRNRADSQGATSTVLSGVGKGLVGIVAKPVGGVAQLISQTGQGILYGTGLMNIPHRRHRQLEQDARINTSSSYVKLARACQLDETHDEIIDTLEYVLEHHSIEHGILILTKNGHFLIYHKDDENRHGNYVLNHIELSESEDSTALLIFNNLSFYVDSRFRQQFLALCRFIRQ